MKLLAVQQNSGNYAPFYEVTCADSYAEAKRLIVQAEEAGAPFDTLDLPVNPMGDFDEFLFWMERRGSRYPFSIFGCSTFQFIRIRDEVRRRGFTFND